jgi:hypothetical protein
MSSNAAKHNRYGDIATRYQSIMNGSGNKNFAKLIRGRFLDRRMNTWMENTYRSKYPNMRLDMTVPGSGNSLRPDVYLPNLNNRKTIFDFGGPSKVDNLGKYSGMADDIFPIVPKSYIP